MIAAVHESIRGGSPRTVRALSRARRTRSSRAAGCLTFRHWTIPPLDQRHPVALKSMHRILIADDNDANRELLEAYLVNIECEIETSVDGARHAGRRSRRSSPTWCCWT